jgi:hypothetical protein
LTLLEDASLRVKLDVGLVSDLGDANGGVGGKGVGEGVEEWGENGGGEDFHVVLSWVKGEGVGGKEGRKCDELK